MNILELLLQATQIAKPIPIAVLISANGDLVKNGILIPEFILSH
jgi:hypothetical protein